MSFSSYTRLKYINKIDCSFRRSHVVVRLVRFYLPAAPGAPEAVIACIGIAEAERTARLLWYLTSEDFRFSNRYQTEMYGIYQRYAENSALHEMEHRRWCADRSIIGYRDTCAERLKDIDCFKLHWSIVPFKDLPEKERDKDRDVIGNMKKILNLGPSTLD